MSFRYAANPFTSAGQWNNIANSLRQPERQDEYRSQYKKNPYVSQGQWKAIDSSARNEWEEKQRAARASTLPMNSYMGQASPRQANLGTSYSPQREIPSGSQPAAVGNAPPVRPPPARSVPRSQPPSVQPSPSQYTARRNQVSQSLPAINALPVVRMPEQYQPSQPQFSASYTPPQVMSQPTFRPSFEATYTNFDGSVSDRPDYAMRDAFIQGINDTMAEYHTGQLSGPPQFDFQAILNRAQEMAQGGFQNPLAALALQ